MIRPIGKNILLKVIEVEPEKKLILTANEVKEKKYLIEDISTDAELSRDFISAFVFLKNYSGTHLFHEEQYYLIVNEDDILAIL